MLRGASLLALGAALVEAAKKKVEAPPPEPTMMAMLKDMVLFDGEFKFLFWVCLVGFCAGNLRMILTLTPNIRFVHGLVLGVLNCYGGSTLAAIICGQPVPFVVNEKLIVELDARPSDSIALAVRQQAPIYVVADVWEGLKDMTDVLEELRDKGMELEGGD